MRGCGRGDLGEDRLCGAGAARAGRASAQPGQDRGDHRRTAAAAQVRRGDPGRAAPRRPRAQPARRRGRVRVGAAAERDHAGPGDPCRRWATRRSAGAPAARDDVHRRCRAPARCLGGGAGRPTPSTGRDDAATGAHRQVAGARPAHGRGAGRLAAPLSRVLDGLKRLPREVTALAVVAFMVALGFGVVAPAIPLFARHFGVSKTEASAVISAFAAARLVTAPFAGRLVNALGERTMLATGIGIVGVSSLLAGFSADYWQLLVLRGIGGVGSIMFSVSAASLLIRVTPQHLRGRAQGVFAGGFLIGSIAGPALGVVAAWSLRAPFFLYAGTLAVAGAIAWGALRHSELAARPVPGQVSLSLRAALRQRAYVATLLTNFAEDWAVVGARSAMVPLFVADRLALSSTWTYVGFFALSAVSGLLLMPFGKRADTSGRRPVLLLGLVLGVAGLACVPLVADAAGLVAVMGLLGVSGAALSVASGAMLGDVVGGRGGTVVATYQMAGDLGTVIGPVAAGWLADAHGYGAAFVMAAAVVAIPIPAVLAAPETAHAGASSEDAARTGTR